MDYRELIRRQIISDMLSRMSDEDKIKLYGLVLNGQGQKEIVDMLRSQQQDLNEIKKGQSWWLDLSSNVVGNAIFDGFVWAISKLAKKI